MKDSGLVLATKNDFAEVEVNCLSGCHDCSAKSLCIGKGQSKGILSVKNPLQARPGDAVTIDIPESLYSRSLIFLFGSLLVAGLLGMAGGYISAFIIALSPSTASVLGLFLGLIIAGAWLFRRFRKKINSRLFPTITSILNKGGQNG